MIEEKYREDVELDQIALDGQELKQRVLRLEQKGICSIGPLLLALCHMSTLHSLIFRVLRYLEGGLMFSRTIRRILVRYYNVHIGMYTYGSDLRPHSLPPGTQIGNYCSIAGGLKVFRRNHPADRLSQHPLFYNKAAGLLPADTIESVADNPLRIGHDVWIGQNVIVAPGCKSIGNGAIIAAGAVLTTDIPPFSVVGGVPAKLIRWRFPEGIRQAVEESQWWTRTIGELIDVIPWFQKSITAEVARKLKETIGTTGHADMKPDLMDRIQL